MDALMSALMSNNARPHRTGIHAGYAFGVVHAAVALVQ